MTGYKQGCTTEGEVIRDFYVEHDPVDLDCEAADDGMTRQEFADECDINVLMATYERNGSLNHFNRMEPAYFDASAVPDLATAIQMAEAANAAFMTLPASARREFDNDPVRFVEFASDPANLSRMREWGLAAPETPKDSPPVPPPVPNPSGGEEKAS